MKIAFIQNDLANSGGTRGINKNISILKECGHEVDVFASCESNCEEWEHPLIHFKNRVLKQDKTDLSERDFSEYDLIVSAGLSSLFEVELIKHDNTVHFCQMYDKLIQPQFNEIIDRLYDKTRFIVHNEPLKKILKAKHDCEVVKIPYGIDFDKFNQHSDLNKNFKRPTLVFLASYFNILKDIPLMQEVFKRMKGWNTRLVAAQKNDDLICDEFFFDPPFAEKCELIASSTIMLHTSKFETWCRVIAESMCLGTPVVGVNSRGPKEYATDDNCVLLDERDPDLIVKNINALYEDKVRYYNMIQNGFDTMRDLDWGVISDDIEAVYKGLS